MKYGSLTLSNMILGHV